MSINLDNIPLWLIILIGIAICCTALYYFGEWFKKSTYYKIFMKGNAFKDDTSKTVKKILNNLEKKK